LDKNDVRLFRLSNVKDERLIFECIDSTAYSFYTNPVYVRRTSNQLGTISLFSRVFSASLEKLLESKLVVPR